MLSRRLDGLPDPGTIAATELVQPNSLRTTAAASHIARSLLKATARGRYFIPQSGAGHKPFSRDIFRAVADARRHGLDLGTSEVKHAGMAFRLRGPGRKPSNHFIYDLTLSYTELRCIGSS